MKRKPGAREGSPLIKGLLLALSGHRFRREQVRFGDKADIAGPPQNLRPDRAA